MVAMSIGGTWATSVVLNQQHVPKRNNLEPLSSLTQYVLVLEELLQQIYEYELNNHSRIRDNDFK